MNEKRLVAGAVRNPNVAAVHIDNPLASYWNRVSDLVLFAYTLKFSKDPLKEEMHASKFPFIIPNGERY